MSAKIRVIAVTDGDSTARKALELAAKRIGGRCISLSAGNPTPISGEEIVTLVKEAAHDPVIIMFDDKGSSREAEGEKALKYLATHPAIDLLGVVAVASNTYDVRGVEVDKSVTRDGNITKSAVDKNGGVVPGVCSLKGDTVDVLNKLEVPIVIGTGDTGKMEGGDDLSRGVPITTRAIEEILLWSEEENGRSGKKGNSKRKV